MAYSKKDLLNIWKNGEALQDYDSDKYRKDICGAWMIFDEYGNRDSKYGWEVDHIDPKGETVLANLRPMQWENNVAKSDVKLKCVVTSSGNDNIDIKK